MWLTSRVILNELNARRTRSCNTTDLLSLSLLQCDTLSLQYCDTYSIFAVAAAAADSQTEAAMCMPVHKAWGMGHGAYPVLFVCIYIYTHSSNSSNLLACSICRHGAGVQVPNSNEVVRFINNNNNNCGYHNNVTMCAYCPPWTRIECELDGWYEQTSVRANVCVSESTFRPKCAKSGKNWLQAFSCSPKQILLQSQHTM